MSIAVQTAQVMLPQVLAGEMPYEVYCDWCQDHLNFLPLHSWEGTKEEWGILGPCLVRACPVNQILLTDLAVFEERPDDRLALFVWETVKETARGTSTYDWDIPQAWDKYMPENFRENGAAGGFGTFTFFTAQTKQELIQEACQAALLWARQEATKCQS